METDHWIGKFRRRHSKYKNSTRSFATLRVDSRARIVHMFWDLHFDFEQPMVLRQIRDLCLSITPKQQALIFLLSPVLVVPSGFGKIDGRYGCSLTNT